MSSIQISKRNYIQSMNSFPHLLDIPDLALNNFYVKKFKYGTSNTYYDTYITNKVKREERKEMQEEDIQMKDCFDNSDQRKRFEVYNQLLITNAIYNEMHLNKIIKSHYIEYLKKQANSGAMIID